MRVGSGGQKALVALALLLALQRAGGSQAEAPAKGMGLLLLDEADSALDDAHRRLLAAALKTSATDLGCQVILTTFRSGL